MSEEKIIKMGVVGLGRAFTIMLPTFLTDARVELAAGVDPREGARRQFKRDFSVPVYASLEPLLEHPEIDVVYFATPVGGHVEQVAAAAAAGKHILIEKPLALTLADCQTIIETVRRAGVELIVGHSHSFDAPIALARKLIAGGTYGPLRMITALNYTDFMYRPRRPDELVTAKGGGVVFSQGAHQIDILRLLGGGRLRSVRAVTGIWDSARPSEGAYSALLTFDNGTAATAVYSGYAHFDSDELQEWTTEIGWEKDPEKYWNARADLIAKSGEIDEADLKEAQTYGGDRYVPPHATELVPPKYGHFGSIIASCDKADIRPLPWGVSVYADGRHQKIKLARPTVFRAEVISELAAVVNENEPPRHTGEWSMATLETCLAILESSQAQKEINLHHQCAVPDETDT